MAESPKRRKHKDNPYTIKYIESKNIYVVSFKDVKGKLNKVEVSEKVYRVFDKFELQDIKELNEYEIDTILNRFKDNETFTCAFLTSCYTGMRTGEVFALTWDDIDLENGIEIRDVADILGHRNVETTENYYISSTKKSKRLATDVFDKITKSEIIEEIIKYK